MTPEDIRMKCLELAHCADGTASAVVARAKAYADFVLRFERGDMRGDIDGIPDRQDAPSVGRQDPSGVGDLVAAGV
jgi:hypothetical protein